jgi:abhydrolase domain-containing protein 12
MHALAPDRIHTVAIDYRGFGASTGQPSEEGLLTDALALVKWAMQDAGISQNRIVVFAQSIGTAVAVSLVHHLATKEPEPVLLKGMILVALFADIEMLTSTYRLAGTIPLLSPLARFPALHAFFKTFLVCEWSSKDRLANFVRVLEGRKGSSYHVTIIHARDDWGIPWSHSETLFWHAVEA